MGELLQADTSCDLACTKQPQYSVSKVLSAFIFMVVLPKTETYSAYRRQKERRKREIKLHFRTDRQA
jgi:hypothetical protein